MISSDTNISLLSNLQERELSTLGFKEYYYKFISVPDTFHLLEQNGENSSEQLYREKLVKKQNVILTVTAGGIFDCRYADSDESLCDAAEESGLHWNYQN